MMNENFFSIAEFVYEPIEKTESDEFVVWGYFVLCK